MEASSQYNRASPSEAIRVSEEEGFTYAVESIESITEESFMELGLSGEIAVTNKLLGIIIAFYLLSMIYKIVSQTCQFIREFICNNFHL